MRPRRHRQWARALAVGAARGRRPLGGAAPLSSRARVVAVHPRRPTQRAPSSTVEERQSHRAAVAGGPRGRRLPPPRRCRQRCWRRAHGPAAVADAAHVGAPAPPPWRLSARCWPPPRFWWRSRPRRTGRAPPLPPRSPRPRRAASLPRAGATAGSRISFGRRPSRRRRSAPSPTRRPCRAGDAPARVPPAATAA